MIPLRAPVHVPRRDVVSALAERRGQLGVRVAGGDVVRQRLLPVGEVGAAVHDHVAAGELELLELGVLAADGLDTNM